MAQSDSYVLAAPQFVPTLTDDLLVTPTGGTQGRLADKLAGGGSPGAVSSTGKIVVSSAHLLSLFSSPVEIIPAPGAGKMVIIVASFYGLIFGTAQYIVTGSFAPALFYTSSAGNPADVAPAQGTVLQGSASAVQLISGQFVNSLVSGTADFENQPVVLTQDADMTDGDGTGSITVLYSIIDL